MLKFIAVFFSLLLSGPLLAAPKTPLPPATAQAAQAGIKTCLPLIEKVETYLAGRQYEEALSFWDNAAADKNLFSALLALENPNGNSLASLNVVQSSDGQCVAEYTQTGYVAQTCLDYAKSLGNAVRFLRDLGKKTAMFQGQGVQIYLTNAGQGCLWVRKEIIKQAAEQSKGVNPKQNPASQTQSPDAKTRSDKAR